MGPIKVRIGVPADVDEVMDLALSGLEESGFASVRPGKVLQEVWAGLTRSGGIIGIIGKRGKPLEGAVLLRISKPWYSEQDLLEERAIYIRSEFRSAKGGRARMLCEFSKQIADGLGLPLLVGVLSNIRTEGKVRLYERQFGKAAGAVFLYRSKDRILKELH